MQAVNTPITNRGTAAYRGSMFNRIKGDGLLGATREVAPEVAAARAEQPDELAAEDLGDESAEDEEGADGDDGEDESGGDEGGDA